MNGMETYLGGSPLVAVGAAFVGGIFAGLSPCVYLMIPIVSAYVGGRSVEEKIVCASCTSASDILSRINLDVTLKTLTKPGLHAYADNVIADAGAGSVGDKNRARSFLLSLCYVVGMAAVYSLLGMIAALTGGLFGSISTSPWALFIVANILVLFALTMLEVIPFPAWFQRRFLKPKRAGGGMAGAVLLGAASGLVASPCTSPVLFALLTYVATTQSVVYGGSLLFAFSMGMGILLIVAGTFSGLAAALPQPGRWMGVVKKVLGLLLLGLAEYYLIKAGQAWFY